MSLLETTAHMHTAVLSAKFSEGERRSWHFENDCHCREVTQNRPTLPGRPRVAPKRSRHAINGGVPRSGSGDGSLRAGNEFIPRSSFMSRAHAISREPFSLQPIKAPMHESPIHEDVLMPGWVERTRSREKLAVRRRILRFEGAMRRLGDCGYTIAMGWGGFRFWKRRFGFMGWC